MSVSIQKYISGRTAVKIAGGIEAAIREGAAARGERLPAVRALAEDLGVSPTTVAAAYSALRKRGLVVTGGRRGTVVAPRPPVARRASARPAPRLRNVGDGNPDPRLLPNLGPALRTLDAPPRLYGEQANVAALVRRATRAFQKDGLPSGEVAVVSGALDGIERLLQAHLLPGDAVAVEDPGFGAILDLVRALGLVPVPVQLDPRGPRVNSLEAALEAGARACILTPRAQNPTGAAFDAVRARKLRTLLRRTPGVLVIEDDHGGPVSGVERHTVCAGLQRWAVVQSVSKYLGPDLRLAFVVGDTETIARVEGRQELGASWVSHLLQHVVLELLRDRKTAARMRTAARTYAQRRRALRTALDRYGISSTAPSGFQVWIPVANEGRTVQGLAQAGWEVAPGERFRLQSPPAIRVTCATLEPQEAEEFARALADVLRPGKRTRVA